MARRAAQLQTIRAEVLRGQQTARELPAFRKRVTALEVAGEMEPCLQQGLQERPQVPCDVHALWCLRENVVALRPNPIRYGCTCTSSRPYACRTT